MKGLQTSLVAPKSSKEKLVLGEHKFVPYFETDILSRFADVTDYANSCFEVIRKYALAYFDGIVEYRQGLNQLRRYLTTDKERTPVLKGVENCGTNGTLLRNSLLQLTGDKTNVNGLNWNTKLPQLLEHDPLLSGLVKSDCLKSILEVILQNGSSMKVNAVQYDVNKQNVGICKSLLSFSDQIPYVDMTYTMAGPGFHGTLDETDSLLSKVSVVKWDQDEVPREIQEVDVMILDNVLSSTARCPIEFLSQIAHVVRENGFVLIQEPTKDLTLPFLLKTLSGTGPPDEGCLRDAASWKSIFQKAGLKLVAEKSDGLLNSMFLCRRTDSTSPEKNIIVFVKADDMDFRWVDDLQRGLRRQAEEGGTVWLYSDNPLNGIYGMMKVLKLEMPKADIR